MGNIGEFIRRLLGITGPTEIKITAEVLSSQIDPSKRNKCSEIGIPLSKVPSTCPACLVTLQKAPGRKTKCPHCGEFMYVRTRPKDEVRVVVTKAQADRIDEEWAIVTGQHEDYLAEKARREKIRSSLRESFGKEPTESDIQWGYLNERRLTEGLQNNWGFYRNTTLQMAEQLAREKRFKDALLHYLEACYLDLNGPQNRGTQDSKWLRQFPPFMPRDASLAPGLIARVEDVQIKLGLDMDAVKRLFLERAKKALEGLRCPISPEACWPSIEEAISKNNDR